jgi:hypothetical protein
MPGNQLKLADKDEAQRPMIMMHERSAENGDVPKCRLPWVQDDPSGHAHRARFAGRSRK